MWGAESAVYNACGGADGPGSMQGRCRGCRSGAGPEGMQERCRLSAPSAPPRALYPVQGGAGGAGTPQDVICLDYVEVDSKSAVRLLRQPSMSFYMGESGLIHVKLDQPDTLPFKAGCGLFCKQSVSWAGIVLPAIRA